jgi:hypothetical protein
MQLTNPTNRRTEARVLHVAGARLFFSYETLIALDVQLTVGDRLRVRRANSWGPTTGRHFQELGCDDFLTVEDDDFDLLENLLMVGVGHDKVLSLNVGGC